jgi:dihydroneopterin aldolase
MNKITVSELTINCAIGIHPHEKETLQPLIISVTLETKTLELPPKIDYALIATQIESYVKERHHDWIEEVAEKICTNLLKSHPSITHIYCSVKKPQAIPNANYAEIEIERTPQ